MMWWLHDGHVGTYVTADARQTTFPPLNSYALLILKGLSSSDIPLNLVQWLAGAASALVVILIGRRAGLGRLALVVTAIFAVTIPTGITVATTAKADWLAALAGATKPTSAVSVGVVVLATFFRRCAPTASTATQPVPTWTFS